MFEKFTSVDAHDFRQRYLNTFGFFRRGEFRQLSKITSIDRVVQFVDRDGVTYTLNPDTDNDVGFEFLPPKSGWHNMKEGAMLVRRIAARRWLRGVHQQNISIMTPMGHRAPVDFEALAEIYENATPKANALKTFQAKGGKTSFLALSDQFAVSWADQDIYCLDVRIGNYKEVNGSYHVSLNDQELWGTEVKDAFTRSGLKIQFVE